MCFTQNIDFCLYTLCYSRQHKHTAFSVPAILSKGPGAQYVGVNSSANTKQKHQTETAIRFTSLCKQSCLTSRGHRGLECTAAYCNCRRTDDSFNLVWSKVTWSEPLGKAFQWIVFSSKPYPLPRLVPGSRCP